MANVSLIMDGIQRFGGWYSILGIVNILIGFACLIYINERNG